MNGFLFSAYIGRKEDAEKALNKYHSAMRRRDAVTISYLLGLITMMAIVLTFIFCLKAEMPDWV
jgi:hypothetical protein